ncbi:MULTISPECIES: aromatic acid exporter family protein [unclassified Granulicatella]|uniref:aromatic acid exporter family protein n=1 Tax=unclassified Granulicatella TaxID=2630493 RepID=UPI001072FCE4|nr:MULTISPECIES: aromatic acid exporter family protein [unclassified Granulicatella]MBF0779977.1 aromatic acid exporter family protein [Granulicatella sp. 19428wC4_WM01]TFU95993.1 aromatic acid exporter family protein [Granulicatella sp. WM01]
MSILERTIKIVLATCLSIYLATLIQLPFATSAGIIAILSILDTRRSSFIMAMQRISSALLALLIGSLCFSLFHFSVWSFGIYLVCYVPIAYFFNLHHSIAPSSVLVAHLFIQQSINWLILSQEILLLVIGTSLALLFNSYMRSNNHKITAYQQRVEHLLQHTLLQVNDALQHNTAIQIGQSLQTLRQTLKEAKQIVYQERDNQLFSRTNYFVHYFDMRENQVKLLEQMVRHLHLCQLELTENKILAGIFYLSANQLSQTNSAIPLLQNITELLSYFRQRPLPQTREEFEGRAILFQLLNDFTHFIQLKVDFYTEYQEQIELNH